MNGLFHSFHHTHTSTGKASHRHENGHGQKHDHKKSDQHKHGDNAHHDEQNSENSADDCCSKNVVEVEKVEKSVSRTIDAPDVTFLTSFILSYSSLFSVFPSQDKSQAPDDVRWRFPATIQNLRIVIQSFQI